MKWANSTKIGKNCPARLVVTNMEDRIFVHFQRCHVGHTPSIRFLHLTTEDRDELAGKIKLGVPFKKILEDIRESVTTKASLDRVHLVDRRDLHNIVRDYHLDRAIVHRDDAFSVDMWVKEQMALGDNSPVLYHKKQGTEDEGPLSKEDFMVVLMSPYQREVITIFASDKVFVDSSHGTTGYDFQLTTTATVDNYGAGCPVAFCLSNKIDGMAMGQFFSAIKKNVGLIKAKVLMTDDADAYVNAWTKVMSKPEHHLICSWHIDKSWTNNLSKIKNVDKRTQVYYACRVLLEELDIEKFEDSLEGFLVDCTVDPDTQSFGDYFEKHYANRTEKWAYCYRKKLEINTNMFLESMNKKIKYCYMEGKKNRRVDKCIGYLMRFSRDMMFDRIIREAKNVPTYRMQKIAHSHHRSQEITDDMVKNFEENAWLVQSSSVGRGPYTVAVNVSCQCKNCPLSCPECHVCVHKFTCSCIDHQIKGNLCKHIHACMRVLNQDDYINKVEEDKVTSAFELHTEQIIEAAQGQCVHVADSVPQMTRIESLVNITLSVARTSTAEGRSKAISQLENLVYLLRQNQSDQDSEESSSLHFPKLPSELPSHQNMEKQRFDSTKKARSTTKNNWKKKPTDLQKASIQTALGNLDRSSEVIHTDFDHTYISPSN